ncbi:Gfo/Idh/MocA family oxidoreductase [Nocardiopsis lambiniae]|uniref:Oxidoreductase n=1 Tax=Nocardiopsis lambiniae TaxID=3075539 RepID=A0ABU2M6R1_9ACTN|nr:oxidoreductase [Nocardiopsis sp. DSM 44743]MDT0328336.1 oxidoreductase [Nocardiopsis sp. DSM 44743]
MLHTLIVGLGRSGRGLHAPSLAKVRAAAPGLFAAGPVMGHDPRVGEVDGIRKVASLEDAARRRPPRDTVVHLCTPPHLRARALERLAGLGYRRIIVEKPLALDLMELAAIARLRRRWGLDLTVATPWSASTLSARLLAVRRSGAFGSLRAATVLQHKPRFTRTLESPGHPTAFDIEVPHALAVVVTLAGGADVAAAELDDMVLDGTRLPGLGGARMDLVHHTGVLTRLESDLTAPLRERRIVLEFDEAVLTGHYPCSETDHTAQLSVALPGREATRSVFPDDALTAFLRSCYTRYSRPWGERDRGDLPVHVEAVRLLVEAKRLCSPDPYPAYSERREVAGEVDSVVGA